MSVYKAFVGKVLFGKAFLGQAFVGIAFAGEAFVCKAFVGKVFVGMAFVGTVMCWCPGHQSLSRLNRTCLAGTWYQYISLVRRDNVLPGYATQVSFDKMGHTSDR